MGQTGALPQPGQQQRGAAQARLVRHERREPLLVVLVPALERSQPGALAVELRRDRRHRAGHVQDPLVHRRGAGAVVERDLLQLVEKERLADAGVAVHVEHEAVPGVVDGEVEVPLEPRELLLPADETGLVPAPDDLLVVWPASPLVNSVKNEGVELLEDLSLFGQ